MTSLYCIDHCYLKKIINLKTQAIINISKLLLVFLVELQNVYKLHKYKSIYFKVVSYLICAFYQAIKLL